MSKRFSPGDRVLFRGSDRDLYRMGIDASRDPGLVLQVRDHDKAWGTVTEGNKGEVNARVRFDASQIRDGDSIFRSDGWFISTKYLQPESPTPEESPVSTAARTASTEYDLIDIISEALPDAVRDGANVEITEIEGDSITLVITGATRREGVIVSPKRQVEVAVTVEYRFSVETSLDDDEVESEILDAIGDPYVEIDLSDGESIYEEPYTTDISVWSA